MVRPTFLLPGLTHFLPSAAVPVVCKHSVAVFLLMTLFTRCLLLLKILQELHLLQASGVRISPLLNLDYSDQGTLGYSSKERRHVVISFWGEVVISAVQQEYFLRFTMKTSCRRSCTSMIRPRTLCPHTFHHRRVHPYFFASLYVSSINEPG